MLNIFSEPTLVALIGLFGGILLGLAARIGQFCTLGAIEDLYYGNNSLRFRMWGIAIGVAIIGTFTLSAQGLLDLNTTLYLSRNWNPLASVFGGLVFGYGMALAGNCGYGALARLGGGDLRSFVIVLVMGISAYISLGGPLARLRIWAFGESDLSTGTTNIATQLSSWINISTETIGIFIGLSMIIITLCNKKMLKSPKHIFWGAIVGLAIISGWAGTEWVAQNGFDATPVISHTFSAPIGETVLYLMTSSGNSISFGTGSIFGVLIGAFIGSLFKGHFRWEACEDPRELKRQILGAALMGIGAVVSIGCSVGQGLSAFSVLAYSAPVTFLAIMIGTAIGLKQLIIGYGSPI
jgi:uncharacterized membrane protein YedE/YeeE